jgi:uncharacterized membrane protein YheB (UPF0754 family)
MNYWLFIIPVISAFISWVAHRVAIKLLFHPRKPKKILGITFQGIFPKRQQQLGERLGKLVSTMFSYDDIENKITNPENLEKILPMIEAHIDDFLRNRLGAEMPMISMFIGDKTITKLKVALMKEIETLFPQVMKQFAGNLKTELNLEKIVTNKITGVSSDELEKILHHVMAKEFRLVEITGAVIGFIIGIIQIIITLLIS